ncbi:MAG: hypothetical protein PHN47_00540 [Clostridia bacterium]|nr:hypothetical protein [Clostridia bacterium]
MELKNKENLFKNVFKKEKTTYRKKQFPLIFLLIVMILAGGTYVWQSNANMSPTAASEIAASAIDKLLNAQSLGYSTESLLTVNGQQICYGTIEGEKADKDTYHAWGNILGSEIDIYQIGNNTYRLDELTHQWLVVPDNPFAKESMLIAEIDPAANFYFSSLGTVAYLEAEDVNGAKCYKLSLSPVLSDEWIQKYFTNINYTLWVDQKTGYLLKALITADTENNGTKGTLSIISEFSDYGESFDIEAPVNSSKTAK